MREQRSLLNLVLRLRPGGAIESASEMIHSRRLF